MTPRAIGPYRVTGTLGEGGMGVVYAAHDERLDRPLAVKVIRHRAEPNARERLWREARMAARLNHPHICQIYEVGESEGELYIAMEQLEGEPLSARAGRGPLPLQEACDIAFAVLSALEGLHQRGLIHRDLKPSNIFLTPHGPKLLDFGLARPTVAQVAGDTAVTIPGALVGTPDYMSPEHITGATLDIRSDLFALGVIMYQMLAGRLPFTGTSLPDLLHAICYEAAPALGGSPAAVSVDRVVHRALEKRPDDRYETPAAMAEALRQAFSGNSTATALSAAVRPVLRLIVLPFRVLRSEPDTDFLAYSLADAVACSLTGLESLVVRSPVAAARYVQEAPDLQMIGREADVDVVLTGSVMSAGGQVRVNAQLVESASGTLLWSQTSQVPMRDLFQLQDDLAQRIVASLQVPLNARERGRLGRDVPASATAYELYLRANQLALDSTGWELARGLYRQSLARDPNYAPAWARLGRCCRVLAKFGGSDDPVALIREAEEAFDRALSINPELSLAHNLYTFFEVDAGRAREAMVRLLERASSNLAEPDLFAGLVQACRYCGLLDASVAAHEHARRLDAGFTTSVAHTFWLLGEYERAREHDRDTPKYVSVLTYLVQGRIEQARQLFANDTALPLNPHLRRVVAAITYTFEGRLDEAREQLAPLLASGFRDPEGWFYWALPSLLTGAAEEGVQLLVKAVQQGYYPVRLLEQLPALDPIRSHPDFATALEAARRGRAAAVADFNAARGPQILGVIER